MDLKKECAQLKGELVAKHGEDHRARIERGVDQVAAMWRSSDGDFAAFVRQGFIADDAQREATLNRLEAAFEQLGGHFNEMTRALRWATDVDVGPLLPIDPLLSGLDPAAHLTDDLFDSKIGFLVLLNFPLTTLKERLALGPSWTRRQWAEARLAGSFAFRVPGEVNQKIAQVGAEADLYIAQYNVWMHHVLGPAGERLFPKGLRLISHWNLRDELKANYADEKTGLAKQRTIAQVMARIVSQTIPAAVIDNPKVDWDPFQNLVHPAPAEAIEPDAPAGREAKADAAPEPDARYARWLAQFQANRLADPHTPIAPTLIARRFDVHREMPEERVVALLTEVLQSPVAGKVGSLIEQRLGRKLEPFDLWYSGFKPRSSQSEAELDALTRKRYPNPQAFASDIPRILGDLGFAQERIPFIASHIDVDPARGAGHAMQAMRRGDNAHLRSRIGAGGMDYKGYNVAIHELGHNVEQVVSLYEVDHTLLAGVPNNAFTEAFAFVFQARDLELLGLTRPDPASEKAKVLNAFWMTWEIAGVALVDIRAWHWLYDHPTATPTQLREAVVQISKDVWNRFFAPILGGKDTVLLGIYSHLIAYPLYTPDYPLGHLIAFQIEEHLKKSPALGVEFERMAKFGCVIPDVWMKNATGAPVSADALLRATEKALSTP
ncbi:MAG: hypothetical protein HY901_13150 [Deltaproteobacteria bacterium]|nr:hypothetical protein [Deltaproteobacteria bacterium]